MIETLPTLPGPAAPLLPGEWYVRRERIIPGVGIYQRTGGQPLTGQAGRILGPMDFFLRFDGETQTYAIHEGRTGMVVSDARSQSPDDAWGQFLARVESDGPSLLYHIGADVRSFSARWGLTPRWGGANPDLDEKQVAKLAERPKASGRSAYVKPDWPEFEAAVERLRDLDEDALRALRLAAVELQQTRCERLGIHPQGPWDPWWWAGYLAAEHTASPAAVLRAAPALKAVSRWWLPDLQNLDLAIGRELSRRLREREERTPAPVQLQLLDLERAA